MKKGKFFKSTFNKYAFFDGANINNQVSFYETTFKQQAHFSNLVINILANNSEPTFFRLRIEEKFYLGLQDSSKIAIPINACIFSNNGCFIIDYNKQKENQNWELRLNAMECDGDAVRVKIRNLSPESKAEIKFKDCHFYGKNVAFTNVAMKNVSITGGNTVKGMLFDHCHFDPTQLTQGLLKNLQFKALAGEEQWIDSQDQEKIKERALVYASLKTTATEGGETQLANDFHFWQQYYQGKLKFSPWNTIYKYTSAYGQSVELPLAWFFCLFIIGIYFYALALTNFNTLTYFNYLWTKGLPISISGSLPFMFSDNDTIKALLPTLPQTIRFDWDFWRVVGFYFGYILQHLAQGFVLFQIGAAIRNKVKR
jgi:hypothetical protein